MSVPNEDLDEVSSLDFCVRSHEFELLEMQAKNKTFWMRLSVPVAVVAFG